MEIKLFRTGRFAHPNPAKQIGYFEKGKIYVVDDPFAKRLIAVGWAEENKMCLNRLTKIELIEFAENKGIEIDTTAKKAEILKAIEDGE